MLDRAEAGLDEVRGGLDAHHTAVPVALQEQGGRLLVRLREGGREGERQGGRERRREGGREGGRREGGREGGGRG